MKNSQKGFIAPILLIFIALLVVGGGVYIYENKKAEVPTVIDTGTQQSNQNQQQTNTQTLPVSTQQNSTKNKSTVKNSEVLFFQNYNKDNFTQYDQAKYYSVRYPKGWAVYQVRGQDTSADSLLLVPQDMANKYIKTSPEKMLSGSETYTLRKAVGKDKQQMIEVGAGFQYSGYVPPEDHEKYLRLVAQSAEKESKENGLNAKTQVIILKGVPRMYSTFDWTENNITTRQASLSWFVKPDPQGRDKDAAPVLIYVVYTTSPENFSEEIFNGVVDSVNENFFEVFFNARSEKKP